MFLLVIRVEFGAAQIMVSHGYKRSNWARKQRSMPFYMSVRVCVSQRPAQPQPVRYIVPPIMGRLGVLFRIWARRLPYIAWWDWVMAFFSPALIRLPKYI